MTGYVTEKGASKKAPPQAISVVSPFYPAGVRVLARTSGDFQCENFVSQNPKGTAAQPSSAKLSNDISKLY